MGVVLVDGGAKISSKWVQEKIGCQQFFQGDLQKRRVEKGLVTGGRYKINEVFWFVFVLGWALLQHVCIPMGINSSLSHDAQFGVTENRFCLSKNI